MADQVPTSRKVPPLAIIVLVVLAALAAVAFGSWRATPKTAAGQLAAPPARPGASQPVLPQPSTAPDAAAPPSDEKGAMGHKNGSDEPGGPATTANVTGRSL